MKASKSISPFRLSSLLRSQNDPTLALQLFHNPNPDANPQKPFRHSLLSYDIIISKLGRAKMFDQMEQILHRMKQETRFAPTEIIFCNVMSYYGRARLPDRALHLFDEMPSFRCERTIKSFNSLLDALYKCGHFDKMKEVLERIEDYGTPDACTYNILIKAFCGSEDLENARKVLDEMRSKGVEPTDVTLGTLIYKLCSDHRVKQALELKEDWERVHGVLPSAFVYASLMKGLCGVGEMALAFGLKDEMVRKNIRLDAPVYSTLISALAKAGRRGEVPGLLEEMSKHGCKPNTVTYNAMIHGCCMEKDFEAAYGVLDEMVEKECRPDAVSYNVIIDALCKEGKWSEAHQFFQDLPRRGCHPDLLSYRMLFSGLCDCGQFQEAAFVLDEMIFKGYAPHYARTHKLVEGLCEEGNMELLATVLSSLQKANVLDDGTWRVVISTLRREMSSDVFELIDTLTMQ
ncbi:putative pentatricopeptide repeat-containing protein At1g53330 [Argentina anserina]|uniref:putative pentatricopeptide repeat-containing protein At1g53330 n=1 Tax=Argentina anserina TaxID=57926 RepID=UPI0021764685|nr:putative pentatricopeptide repeat-containing protein At1g53330 [Potentilla anserina]